MVELLYGVFVLEREHVYLKDKLEYPAESKDTDYKAAVKFDEKTDFAAKLVKHILGFANSGFGYIFIGYREQSDRSLVPDPDMTEEIVASYEVTRLCQYVEKFIVGQDRIQIKIFKEEFNGATYPIISISRFSEYPFVCTKDYLSLKTGETILESGQIYIRIEGARTVAVNTPAEWRQLIRECINASKEIEAKRPTKGKANEWENQFFTWVENEKDYAIGKIKKAGFLKGFFKFIIRVPYGLNQINNTSLLKIAEKSECHKTGWPIGVVMTKREYKPISLTDGIRAVINTGDGFDYWAMNNRGHFFFLRSHQEDNANQDLTEGKKVLWFDLAIWRISEILFYTANLCSELNLNQGDEIKLGLSYEGLQGRMLSASRVLRRSIVNGECTAEKFETDLEICVIDIMPKLKEYVYQIAIGLFGYFDFYNPDRDMVDNIIDEFLNARK